MSEDRPYNPLDTREIAANVADKMLLRPVHALGSLASMRGAGIYAIYYSGKFPAYRALAGRNKEGEFKAPIYVGKAAPKGKRKGGMDFDDAKSLALIDRLRDHADSIKAAKNLDIDDFFCRYLIVDHLWLELAESMLIARFSPLWNKLIDGFGNHDPGSGRHAGKRSRWDVLHPGRIWAPRLQPRTETAEQIAAEVQNYLRNMPQDHSGRLL